LPETLDALDLTDGKRLAIVADGDGLAALPMVRGSDGRWRRARAGDGVAEALLNVLARQAGRATEGRFTIQSWIKRTALGEKAIEVDQTNESVIVGDSAVVKWAAHLQEGPHPAPHRVAVLRRAGFAGMPAPWGLVTWQPADGEKTLAASVDEYLPGAVDGWTWAVWRRRHACARDRCANAAVPSSASAGWCRERTTTCAIRATRMMSFGYWPRCSYPSSWPLGRGRLSGCRPRRRRDTRHRAS
jgi:maltokinase